MEISYNSDSSATEYDSEENDEDNDIDSPGAKKKTPKVTSKATEKPKSKPTDKAKQAEKPKPKEVKSKADKKVIAQEEEEVKTNSRKQKRASPTPQATQGKKARTEDPNETEDFPQADGDDQMGDALYKREPDGTPSKESEELAKPGKPSNLKFGALFILVPVVVAMCFPRSG